MDTPPNTTNKDVFQPQIYFLEQIDDQLARVLQAMTQGQSARLEIPRDGEQFRRLIPLFGSWLLQGKNILVMVPTEQHLEELNMVLTENNLTGLSFRIQETLEMRKQLQLSLAGDRPPYRLQKQRWQSLEKQSKRLAELLDAQYHGLLAPVFGKHNRQNLMAAYLSAHQVSSKAWLAGLIPTADMVFSMECFSRMKIAIETAEKQYQGQLEHPLAKLNARFFSKPVKEAASELKQQLDQFLTAALKLRRLILSRIDHYQSSLQHYYDQHYYECAALLRELIHSTEDFVSANGQSLTESGGLASRKSFFGLINGQQAIDHRQIIINNYEQLRQLHEQTGEVDFHLTPASECYQPVPVLNQYQTALIDWHQSIPQLLQEQLIRLNRKTVHPASEQLTFITELEVQIAVFVEQLNHSALFHEIFLNNSLTILQQQQLLNEVIQQLQAVQYALPTFAEFCNWQCHWLQCEPTTQKIILQLAGAGAKDWLSIFESWFWYQCLLQLSARDLPRDDQALEQLSQTSKQLQQLIPEYLYDRQLSQWPAAKKVLSQLKQFSSDDKVACLDLAKKCFPLLLCTESQLNDLLTKQFQTDVLLVLDATFFPEKTIRSLARQHLLTSDFELPATKKKNNLWEEPGLGSIQHFKLGVTTGITSPGLRFYLASLFGNFDHRPSNTQQIELHSVMGRTNETDGSNEAEARQIIQYLHQLQSIEDGRPPRNLTILCTTEGQQKRIRYYFQESLRRQVAGADWLTVLQEKGLRILQLSDVKGQQTGRVIVSLVVDGTQTDSMEWLLDEKELPAIQSLLSMALDQFVLFHSIPEDVRVEWLKSGHPILVLLSHWLAYGRAVSKSIGSQQKQILQAVSTTKSKKRPDIPLIYRAIAQALLPYFPAERIQMGIVKGQLHFPLVVWPEVTNETGVVILVDNVVNQEAMYPWLGAIRLKNAAYQHGFQVIETWSTHWWQDPDQTARQIAGKIMRVAQVREAY